jgi:hypothetical protein
VRHHSRAHLHNVGPLIDRYEAERFAFGHRIWLGAMVAVFIAFCSIRGRAGSSRLYPGVEAAHTPARRSGAGVERVQPHPLLIFSLKSDEFDGVIDGWSRIDGRAQLAMTENIRTTGICCAGRRWRVNGNIIIRGVMSPCASARTHDRHGPLARQSTNLAVKLITRLSVSYGRGDARYLERLSCGRWLSGISAYLRRLDGPGILSHPDRHNLFAAARGSARPRILNA